ncbi:hypothetical protein [Dokdonella sp.]|uniref:hypothetical protein n=1 Tax=Dokdonella sp. TaxID=2291710 RepID=UPI0025C02F0B|nr:hypothetical protein [Dokdonella sp.]MBX3688910.1 hypothetical protein [Dokdonella sp.]
MSATDPQEAPGWHQIEIRSRGPRRRDTPPSRREYHAKWIAINAVIVVVSAWIYGTQLIPRYISHTFADPASLDTEEKLPLAAARNLPQESAAARSRERAPTPRPLAPPRAPPPLTPAVPAAAAYYTPATAASLGYKCIGGVAYRHEIVDGVPTYTSTAAFKCLE